jgi:hypothetical protein
MAGQCPGNEKVNQHHNNERQLKEAFHESKFNG